MRTLGKVFCFLAMIGLALGQIFSLGGVIGQQGWVSACTTAQECQDQYVRNLLHCFAYSDATHQTNICGQDIDPAYVAVTSDWQERRQKFFDIAKEEQQKLSPDVLQAKQERIRNIIKEHYHITKSQANVAIALFLLSLILPIICLVADWLLDRKANKIMFHGDAPSTQIMLLLLLFFASALGTVGIVFGEFGSIRWSMIGVLLILILLAAFILLAMAIFQEGRRFQGFARAVRQAKGELK